MQEGSDTEGGEAPTASASVGPARRSIVPERPRFEPAPPDPPVTEPLLPTVEEESAIPPPTRPSLDAEPPRQRGWIVAAVAAVLVVMAGVAVAIATGDDDPVADQPTPSSSLAPATTMAGATTTTAASPAVDPAGATCEQLAAAPEGATISIGGSLACDLTARSTGVTVSGRATGWITCRRCDRWTFRVELSGGNEGAVLHMIGGDGWVVEDSVLSGVGGSGVYGVFAVGMTPENGQPTNWTIRRSQVVDPGNSPAHQDNLDHAVYVIAGNGDPLNGVIDDVTIRGGGAGAALKIGGTGNDGGFGDDAADKVTVINSTITNVEGPDPTCVLIATNSDDVTFRNNELDCPGTAFALDGPWTGERVILRDNMVSSATGPFMLVHHYNHPELGAAADALGTDFDTIGLADSPCPRWGSCLGNARG
ncbi:MAG TPA: hypothetical protein VJM33_12830 [Microthrixaceae bacterium]|nr:hypothetical protein [Microthrixaceae bacterium]